MPLYSFVRRNTVPVQTRIYVDTSPTMIIEKAIEIINYQWYLSGISVFLLSLEKLLHEILPLNVAQTGWWLTGCYLIHAAQYDDEF